MTRQNAVFGLVAAVIGGLVAYSVWDRVGMDEPLPETPSKSGRTAVRATRDRRDAGSAETPDESKQALDRPIDDRLSATDPPVEADVHEQAALPEKTDPAAAAKHTEAPPPAKPLLDGWPEPKIALVLSGDMHGYIEPCGCSLNQLGGLSRRADLLKQLHARGWPTGAFDTGGLVNNPARQQAKIKLQMALDALFELKYAGVALGVEELRIGVDLLRYTPEERPPFL